MSQYALVPKAEPVTVVTRDGEASEIDNGKSSVTAQLLNLYEAYAETYPNPAIQEENHERDRLLRAISAANHAVQVNPKKEPTKSSWWNVFGGTKSSKTKSTRPSITDDENDDDRLVYTEMMDDDQECDREFLLGTGFSLDCTCIPEEVHSLARRYLCQNRKTDEMQHQAAPNVVRTSWETAGTSCIVIVGLGQLVEFRKRTNHNDSTKPNTTSNNTSDHTYTSSGHEVYTSDRTQLLEYYSIRQKKQQSSGRKMLATTRWNPSLADAAMVGPNFLSVHWGLDDTVTFYRRVASPPEAVIADDSHFVVTWEAVAVSGATATVRDSLADIFGGDDDEDGDTELINVTAVHPLVVEIPQHAPIVTIAVARLGGFIELLPLPPQMWYGAELPFTKKHLQSYVSKRGTKRKSGDAHKSRRYTMGLNLPDLAVSSVGGGGVVVLNTSEYHSDVYGIESLAISDNRNESWNQELYPDGPPAQYVIAAYGTNSQTGRQAISFWSYSTHVAPSAPGGVGFSIHSTIVEAIDPGKAGPDLTLFASPIIFRHWRKPRRVELRDSGASEAKTKQITTLSLSVPIVQISFVLLDGNQSECGADVAVCAAVLDWNGGVTLLDCSLLVRTAAQTLKDDEYRVLFGNDSQTELTSLVNVMANRTRITRTIANTARLRSAQICMTQVKCFQNPSNKKGEILVAAMSRDSLYFICSTYKSTGKDSLLLETTTVPCPNLGIGQFLMSSKRQFILNLIFQATHYTNTIPSVRTATFKFCSVQKLKPYDIIESLMRSSKFREAIAAAENLPPTEKNSVEAILDDCKKAVWEAEFDTSVLDSIRDNEYIVDMACRPPLTADKQVCNSNFLYDKVDLYYNVCQLALKRIRNTRSWTSLSFADDAIDIKSRLVKLGTYALLCDYRSVTPSLMHFLNDFIRTPMLDFALSCAKNADIATLSVLWFRHRDELHPDHLRLLNAIPVTVSPIFYQHLLPVISMEKAVEYSQIMFIHGLDFNDLCSSSEMPDYMDYHFQRMILLDEDDELLLREQYAIITQKASAEQYNVDALADWYVYRAHEIQKFAPSLASVATFAQLGLNALQIQNFDPLGEEYNLPPSVLLLRQFLLFSELMCMLPSSSKYAAKLGFKDLDALSASDIVALTFDCGGLESLDYQTRHSKYLLPLIRSKMTGCAANEVNALVDDAIVNFCTNLLECCESRNAADFIGKVTICSNIIHLSRTSLCITTRIIKSTAVIVRLATRIVEITVKNSSLIQMAKMDEQSVVNRLWKIYESLPVMWPSSSDSNEVISTTIDNIGRSLTFLDIVVRWPISDAFVMVFRYQKVQDTIELRMVGEETIALLCRSFGCQVESSRSDVLLHERAPTMLSALVNDCNELNTNCFEGDLQISVLLIKYIAIPLIRQNNAGLLGEFLKQSGHSRTESKAIANEVLLCVNDALICASIGNRREIKMKAAMEFKDVIRKWLPVVRDEFQPLQQCLDAMDFIASTLLSETSTILSMEQIQSMRAHDVVEHVLRHNPRAILQNCSDWENPALAEQSNEMIRHQSRYSEDNVDVALLQPTSSNVPGEAIFYLAQLLGLTDMLSVITVKSQVIDVAIGLSLYGAAAAVCRSLMIDSVATNVGNNVALAAVAKIVFRKEYDDALTKQELCSTAQHLFSASIQVRNLDSFEIIVASWNLLQQYNVLWLHDACYALMSFGNFYRDSIYTSGVDIVERVASLNILLTKGLMNDTSIAELAKFASLWCIDHTMKARKEPYALQESAADVLASFAAALFLHVRDPQVSLGYLNEVIMIFAKQRDNISMLLDSATTDSAGWLDPNPDIVKKLIGRGYSENGARRSAAAVSNRSVHEALQWAVAHSLDLGFDDPQIILHSTNAINIDLAKADYLKNVFTKLIVSIEDEWSDIKLKNVQSVGPPSIAVNIDEEVSSDDLLEKANTDEEARNETMTSVLGNLGSLEKDVNLNESERTALSGVLHDGDRNGGTTGSFLPTVKQATTSSNVHTSSDIEQNIPFEISTAVILTSKSAVKASHNLDHVASTQKNSSIKVTIPKSSETSPDRSMLYQVGQEAFVSAQQRRRPSSNPSRAERLRLIEEGRRLLKQAKSGLSSGSEQNGLLLRSAPTTPSSIYSNKEANMPVAPAHIVARNTNTAPINNPDSSEAREKPPDNTNEESKGGDEWDFDDENFDL